MPATLDSEVSLWPESIQIDVRTPVSILKEQAGLLARMTKGILRGEVDTAESGEMKQHRLIVVAPSYNGYRHTLLTAEHHQDLPYPVTVEAKSLEEDDSGFGGWEKRGCATASSEEQFTNLLRSVLRSGDSSGVIHALIANSNDKSPQATKALSP